MEREPITCIHRSALAVALGERQVCAKCRDDTLTYGAQDAAADHLARVSVSRRPPPRVGPGQRSRGIRHN